jgi:hypothetical protein
MPYPTTSSELSPEIKLFYQVYSNHSSKPKDAVLFDINLTEKYSEDVIDDLAGKGIWNETLEAQLKTNQLYFKVFRDDEMVPANAIQFDNIRILPNPGLLSLEKPLQNAISNSMNWVVRFIPTTVKRTACDAYEWMEDRIINLPHLSSPSATKSMDEEEYFDAEDKEVVGGVTCSEIRSEDGSQQTEDKKNKHDKIETETDSSQISLAESLLNTAWRCTAYVIQNPVQALTLLLAASAAANTVYSGLQQMPAIRNSQKCSQEKYSEENNFGYFTSLLTQTSFVYSTSSFLQGGGRYAANSIAVVSLVSFFSSVSAQPWRATFPTPYNLSNLDGQSGVKFVGNPSDGAGVSVCSVGDVNGDKRSDLLIGTYTGNAAYLVYGGPWLNTPTFALSTLDGTTGVKFVGVSTGTPLTSYSISKAGDVNGDGNPDFLISAPGENSGTGAVYLIYGSSQFNQPTFSLSNLDGKNGVKLLGVSAADSTGYSVSGVGDVNGDGKPDFLIGAYGANNEVGVVYLVYGGAWLNTPTFSLNNLGAHGVKFLGVSVGDKTGIVVNAAGDVNGDGKADFFIGTITGTIYLVYGGSWSTSSFPLSSLNGQNGVKFFDTTLTYTATAAGDINGDGKSDFLISAWIWNENTGAVYLVYGGPWLNQPTFSLSNLNGVNGVKFLGVSPGDYTGAGVKSAGDMNGDGIPDILIGAPRANSNKGFTYLIYGGSWLNMPTFSLANLTPDKGIKFIGTTSDPSGSAPSFAGDMNGDGATDIVLGSWQANNNAGAAYLIHGFGFTLWNNQLNLYRGARRTISPFMLNTTGVITSGKLIITPGEIQHGQFENIVNPGVAITSFTKYQISRSQIQFVHDGSLSAPAYMISISADTAATISPNAAKITFIKNPLILLNNSFTIQRAQTILLTQNQFKSSGTPAYYPVNTTFALSPVQHGYFENVARRGYPITSFTQREINLAQIRFVHDGKGFAPSFNVTLFDPGIQLLPKVAKITFIQNPPVLVKAQLVLERAQTILLTPLLFNSTGTPAYFPNQTTFTVNTLRHGYFKNVVTGVHLTSFTQGQINRAQIQFVHDGTKTAPRFNVTLFDPGMSSLPEKANIQFVQNPLILLKNDFAIERGQTILLTQSQLNSRGTPAYFPVNTTFALNNITHGHFESLTRRGYPLTSFTQWQINAAQIQFVHDGSEYKPMGNFTLFDPGMKLLPQPLKINFTQNPLKLLNKGFLIERGQTILLSNAEFKSTGTSVYYPLNTTFALSPVQNGYFENIARRGHPLTYFTQWQINHGRIQFVHDGKGFSPSFNVTLFDPGMRLLPQISNITFIQNPPILVKNQLVLERAQTILLTPFQFNSTGIPLYFPNQTMFSINNLTHGYFENIVTGKHIISFTQYQINHAQIMFVHDGTEFPPRFNVTLFDPGMKLLPRISQISFKQNPLRWLRDSLLLERAQKILLTPKQFNSSSTPAYFPLNTTFLLNNIAHGRFENVAQPGRPITSFTQYQINHAQIQVVHDGSEFEPRFNITLSDPGMKLRSRISQISFKQNPLRLLCNNLVLERAQKILLTPLQFNGSGTSVYFPVNTTFALNINNLHGRFELVAKPGQAITSFTQSQINQAQIQFVHDGKGSAPSFNVTLIDPGMRLSSQISNITFIQNPPVLLNRTLTILQGGTIILSNAQLGSLSIPYPDSNTLSLKINNEIQYGYFEYKTQIGQRITTFTQQEINQGKVQFVHDGSCDEPVFTVTLSDPGMTLPPVSGEIVFVNYPSELSINQLTITQGDTITLGPDQLAADTKNQNLRFIIENQVHITFSSDIFTWQDLRFGRIKITHDGSLEKPTYNVSFTNCDRSYGPWSPTVVKLNPKSPTVIQSVFNSKISLEQTLIASLLSSGMSLGVFVLKFYLEYLGKKRLKKVLENKTGSQEEIEFHQNIILPVADKVFSVIKVTGICSDFSEERMNLYRDAVIHLVGILKEAGNNIQLDDMDPLQKNVFLSTVARQTKKHLVPDVGCCSSQNFVRFFVAHASPEDIWDKSKAIAEAVKKDLENAYSKPSIEPLEVEEPQNRDSLRTPLLS